MVHSELLAQSVPQGPHKVSALNIAHITPAQEFDDFVPGGSGKKKKNKGKDWNAFEEDVEVDFEALMALTKIPAPDGGGLSKVC